MSQYNLKCMSMKKKFLRILIISVSFLVIIISCQKELIEESNVRDLDILVARNWFESNFSKDATLGSKGAEIKTFKAKPNWNNAQVNQHEDSKTVEVPMDLQEGFGYATD